jgi:hypothetical protein
MSWKTFGGIQQINSANINTQTIATDNIILRKAYSGNFVIDGSVIVATDTEISGNLMVNNHTVLNDVCMNKLNVNNTTVLNGNVVSNETLFGNIIHTNTLESSGNALFDSQVFLNNYYLYGDVNGIGVNTMNPTASFDICSNIVAGLNIHTSKSTNKNILACNSSKNGIVLGANTSGATIDFFTNMDISNNVNGDAYIYSSNNGIMTMKTANNTQILSNVVVSGSQNNLQTRHLSNETLALYDNIDPSGEYYFSNVYDGNTKLGRSAAFISSDDTSFNSVTNIFLSTNTETNQKYGASIVGGLYPPSAYSTKRSMLSYGITDKSGNYMPTETIVQGSLNNTKYLATTGMNTYMPRTDQYVVDINGPVIIDNGDIVNVNNTKFEILDVKHAIDSSYKNCIMAIGASTDVSGSYKDPEGNRYRYSVIFSNDSGATWNSTILYPSSNSTQFNNVNYVLEGNVINQLDIYDCSYAFITGDKNTLIYTWDGGYSWKKISSFLSLSNSDPSFNGANFNAIKVKRKTNDILSLYLSVDIGNISKLIKFDISFNELNGDDVEEENLIEYKPNIHINSIGLSDTKLYVAGDKIIIYNLTDISNAIYTVNRIESGETPAGVSNNFIWSKINVYNDNYAIAIATGFSSGFDGNTYFYGIKKSLISVIKNHNSIYHWYSFNDNTGSFITTVDYGNNNIFKYPMNCVIKDIYINDLSNAIIVGNCNEVYSPYIPVSTHVNGSFILLSNNAYNSGNAMSWNDMPSNLLNASGKMNLLINESVSLDRVTITNPNTILFFSTITPSIFDPIKKNCTETGASNVYSCFTPNYLNSANNHVMDVCGNMSVYGSFFANSVSSNSAFQQLSDYRIKTDVLPLPTGNILDNLRPVQYTNKLNGNCEWGFIAHELQEYLPELVKGEKDGENYQSINYNGIIALLVKEVQVLKHEISNLRK